MASAPKLVIEQGGVVTTVPIPPPSDEPGDRQEVTDESPASNKPDARELMCRANAAVESETRAFLKSLRNKVLIGLAAGASAALGQEGVHEFFDALQQH